MLIMNLEILETKELIIKDFFTWLFDDERIIDKDVTLESEIDFTLAPYYMDPNIYYPKQLSNFFNTKAMQRLSRISQLDLAIDVFPNVYHNRLQHSKGTYYRKLEEMLHNFQNDSWKEYIEKNKMKLYLLAELIKVAGHDIGHLPLSHALEEVVFSCHDAHETLGKRIMLENTEIQEILISISPELPNTLHDLYEKHVLNFKEHDESSYDVDRFDYILRDNLYAGFPVYVPYSHYETISVSTNEFGLPKTNIDGSISPCKHSNFTIDVYPHSALRNIETLLETRENGYKKIYFSSTTHIREHSIDALFRAYLPSFSQSGKELKDFINSLHSYDINTIDLSSFLEWDDIKFYSQILDIAEKHEDPNIRLLATMTIPNMKAFLTMIYSHLNIYDKGQLYSNEDKKFLRKIKSLIQGKDLLSQNLRDENFAMENTIVYSQQELDKSSYTKYIENGLIHSSTFKIKSYNPLNPIYIKGTNGKIYELSHHPDRKYDWHTRNSYISTIYSYIPFLKLNGLSDDEINKMRNLCMTTPIQKDNIKTNYTVNMQPLKIGHNIEDCFLEL